MNANEVIANRALEILGYRRGDYQHLHPLEHVNLSQSTNDVYQSALKLALDTYIARLLDALDSLRIVLIDKATEFVDAVKLGRTQLQDAVPMTLGQELAAFAVTLAEYQDGLREARLLHELNLGGTAIGTQLNAHPEYRRLAVAHLRDITGISTLRSAEDLVEATSDVGVFVLLSGVLKRIAVKLSKTCNDLRLLSSARGPASTKSAFRRCRPGRALSRAKSTHPVIPEVVSQVADQVIGYDVTVTLATEGGQLQLNAFEPIIAHSLFSGLQHHHPPDHQPTRSVEIKTETTSDLPS